MPSTRTAARWAAAAALGLVVAGCTTTITGTASPAATPIADGEATQQADVRLSMADLQTRSVDDVCADLPVDAFADLDAETGVPTFDDWTEYGDAACYLWTSYGDIAVSVELMDRRDAEYDFLQADDPWVPTDGLGDEGWVLLDPTRTTPEGRGPVQVAALSGDVAIMVSLYSAKEGPYPELEPVEAEMRTFVPELIAAMGTPGTPVGGPPPPEPEVVDVPDLPAPDPTDGPAWTIAALLPALQEYADDRTGDYTEFAAEYVFIPCGGQGAHGVGAGVVDQIEGGATLGASVELFVDATAAQDEYLRLRDLATGCTAAFDFLDLTTGEPLAACDPLEVTRADQMTRYLSTCDLSDPRDTMFFRSGNAVITLDSLASSGVNDDTDYWLTLFQADA